MTAATIMFCAPELEIRGVSVHDPGRREKGRATYARNKSNWEYAKRVLDTLL